VAARASSGRYVHFPALDVRVFPFSEATPFRLPRLLSEVSTAPSNYRTIRRSKNSLKKSNTAHAIDRELVADEQDAVELLPYLLYLAEKINHITGFLLDKNVVFAIVRIDIEEF